MPDSAPSTHDVPTVSVTLSIHVLIAILDWPTTVPRSKVEAAEAVMEALSAQGDASLLAPDVPQARRDAYRIDPSAFSIEEGTLLDGTFTPRRRYLLTT
jgi:hypothetical protein